MKTFIVTSLVVLFASTAIILDVQSWQHRRELSQTSQVIELGPGCGDAVRSADGNQTRVSLNR